MATHYVYEDPDKRQLGQGDVLRRTPELVELLQQYHPHYAEHPDYKFFVVLTQTCDLVRRGKKGPKADYIAIGPARTLEDALLREAAKTQKYEWQREVKVIGSRERTTLLMFLSRLIDNNEPGYFYLHVDQELGIYRSCCAVLSLSITLRVQHYDALLDAKIAQLKDTFQAKLGWLIGNMYGRVGTTEWDTENPETPLKKETERIIDESLHSVTDEQIKEGIAELNQNNDYESKTPDEIFEYIRNKKVLPRKKKIELIAAEACQTLRLVNLIGGRARIALHEGDALKNDVLQILSDAKIPPEAADDLADTLIHAFEKKMGQFLTDANLPDRDDIAIGFIRGVLQHPQISSLLG